MFIPIEAQYLEGTLVRLLRVVQLILLVVSFASLFEFGISVLRPFHLTGWLRGMPAALLGAWTFVVFFILLPLEPDLERWHHTADALARYFIGFPGGLLAALWITVTCS